MGTALAILLGSLGAAAIGGTVSGITNYRNRKSQEKINEQIMSREDSSYQRTVADMNKAGLSPLSMSGIDGSGTLSAPQDNNPIESISAVMNIAQQAQAIQANKVNMENTQLQNEALSISNKVEAHNAEIYTQAPFSSRAMDTGDALKTQGLAQIGNKVLNSETGKSVVNKVKNGIKALDNKASSAISSSNLPDLSVNGIKNSVKTGVSNASSSIKNGLKNGVKKLLKR